MGRFGSGRYFPLTADLFQPPKYPVGLPEGPLARGAKTGADWPNSTGYSSTPGGKDHGAQRSGLRPGNEVFALLGRTGTGRCPVVVTDTRLFSVGVSVVLPSLS